MEIQRRNEKNNRFWQQTDSWRFKNKVSKIELAEDKAIVGQHLKRYEIIENSGRHPYNNPTRWRLLRSQSNTWTIEKHQTTTRVDRRGQDYYQRAASPRIKLLCYSSLVGHRGVDVHLALQASRN
jgi:hypothetical protein